MASATRRSIEHAIERLDAQRRRYALAVDTAPSERARDRHRRNVARLDEELAAHRDALHAMVSAPDVAIVPAPARPTTPGSVGPPALVATGVAMLSGHYARFELEDALGLDRGALARLVAIAFVAGFLLVAFGMMLAAGR